MRAKLTPAQKEARRMIDLGYDANWIRPYLYGEGHFCYMITPRVKKPFKGELQFGKIYQRHLDIPKIYQKNLLTFPPTHDTFRSL